MSRVFFTLCVVLASIAAASAAVNTTTPSVPFTWHYSANNTVNGTCFGGVNGTMQWSSTQNTGACFETNTTTGTVGREYKKVVLSCTYTDMQVNATSSSISTSTFSDAGCNFAINITAPMEGSACSTNAALVCPSNPMVNTTSNSTVASSSTGANTNGSSSSSSSSTATTSNTSSSTGVAPVVAVNVTQAPTTFTFSWKYYANNTGNAANVSNVCSGNLTSNSTQMSNTCFATGVPGQWAKLVLSCTYNGTSTNAAATLVSSSSAWNTYSDIACTMMAAQASFVNRPCATSTDNAVCPAKPTAATVVSSSSSSSSTGTTNTTIPVKGAAATIAPSMFAVLATVVAVVSMTA